MGLKDLIAQSSSEGDAEQTEYADNWRPEPGDMVAGTVVRGDIVRTKDGKVVHLLVVHDEETDKDWTVWCSGRMLKDLVIEKAPAEGDLIVVEFHGKFPVQSKPEYSFNKFTMVTENEPNYEYWKNIMLRFKAKQEMLAESAPGGAPQFAGAPSGDPMEAPF